MGEQLRSGGEEAANANLEDVILAEHRAALAGLSTEQRRALARIASARREAVFRNEHWRDALKRIIHAEAERRRRDGDAEDEYREHDPH